MATLNTTTCTVVNAEGLKCPLPVLRLQKALDDLAIGAMLQVRATDENTATDIPAVCRAEGHIVHGTRREDDVLIFDIEKGR